MSFECDKCHKDFNNSYRLKVHRNKKFSCVPVEPTIVADQTPDPEKKTCDICDKTFVSNYNLRRHQTGKCQTPNETPKVDNTPTPQTKPVNNKPLITIIPDGENPNMPLNNCEIPNKKSSKPKSKKKKKTEEEIRLEKMLKNMDPSKYTMNDVVAKIINDEFVTYAVCDYINQVQHSVATIYVYTEAYGDRHKIDDDIPKLHLTDIMSKSLISLGTERLNELFELCRFADTRTVEELMAPFYDVEKSIQCMQCMESFKERAECVLHQVANCPNNATINEKRLVMFKTKFENFNFVGLKRLIMKIRENMENGED